MTPTPACHSRPIEGSRQPEPMEQPSESDRDAATAAGLIQAILGDLNLSPEQQALVPQVVPHRLRELAEGGA